MKVWSLRRWPNKNKTTHLHIYTIIMNNQVKIVSAIVLAFCLLSTTTQATEVSVTDFGVHPNSFMDATPGLKKAIAVCRDNPGSRLTFPKGRYDFWNTEAEQREYFISNTTTESEAPSKIKNIALLFDGIQDLVVDGNGSLFVFHGKTITWAIDHSENIHLKNFSVDFERPSMSELTFLEVHPNHAIVSIHPDSKYSLVDNKLCFYGENWVMDRNYFSILVDTIEGLNVYSSFDPILNAKAEEITPFHLKLTGDFSSTNYREGTILTTRNHVRDHVGAFINRSKDVVLENVTMHYMHGLGIVSQFSENLTFQRVKIEPSRGRAIAAFADGMHFSGCKGHILIENCKMKGLHDDPINVHGTFLKITEILAPNKIKVRFMHGQTYGMPAFFEGDTVGFVYSAAIQSRGLGIVKHARLVSEREMEVELQANLLDGVVVGDCLENMTWYPSLTVRNSRFESTNTRGLLVTTPKPVLIENNHFYRTGMYAIQIACDAGSWYESGSIRDVLIRNNLFEDCAYNFQENSYPIALVPENHKIAPKHWVHHNIRVEQNTFRTRDGLLLRAKSTKGIYFVDNEAELTSFPLPDSGIILSSIQLDNCDKVTILRNKLPFTLTVAVSNMDESSIQK